MIQRQTLACGAIAGAAILCLPLNAGALQPVVRDSAGIRVVENRSAPRVSTVRVNSSPDLIVGTRSGSSEFTLYRVNDARTLANGSIVVANGLELLWLSREGRLIARAGGAGDGPGEYREIAGIALLPGDTLIVVNRVPPVANWYSPTGKFLRSARFANLRGAPLRFSRLADGSWTGLAFGGERPPATPALFFEDWFVERRWIGRARPDTIAKVAGEHYFGDARRSVRITGSPRAFLWVAPTRIVAASSGSYEFRVFSAAGKLTHIVRNAAPNPPISIAQASAPSPQPATGRVSETGAAAGALAVPSAASAPAFHNMAAAADGSVWIRRSPATAASAEWHVYDPGGMWVATVLLPGRFRPTEITPDHILGIQTDELDVEFVARYSITR